MTLVYRGGRMVEKSFANAFDGPPARSNLPCPNVIRDGMEPLQHQANGRMYDSKRAMEKADKEAGCVCIGNEVPKTEAHGPPPITEAEVAQAYDKVAAGYKPNRQVEGLPKDIQTGWI